RFWRLAHDDGVAAMTFLLVAVVMMTGAPELEVDPTGHVFTSREGIELALGRFTRGGMSTGSKVWLARVWESLEISEYTVKIGKKDHRLLITRAGFPIVYLPEDGREVSIHWYADKS